MGHKHIWKETGTGNSKYCAICGGKIYRKHEDPSPLKLWGYLSKFLSENQARRIFSYINRYYIRKIEESKWDEENASESACECKNNNCGKHPRI